MEKQVANTTPYLATQYLEMGGGGVWLPVIYIASDLYLIYFTDIMVKKQVRRLGPFFSFWQGGQYFMRFPTMWYVRQAKAQTSLRIRLV